MCDNEGAKVRVFTRVRPLLPNVIPEEAFQVPVVTAISDDTIAVQSCVARSSAWFTDSGMINTTALAGTGRTSSQCTRIRTTTPSSPFRRTQSNSNQCNNSTINTPRGGGGGIMGKKPSSPFRRMATDSDLQNGPSTTHVPPPTTLESSVFTYDAVMDMNSSQEEVFEGCDIAEIIDCVLDGGSNGCIMCYGPTGSGKTHTMVGEWRYRRPAAPVNSTSAEENKNAKNKSKPQRRKGSLADEVTGTHTSEASAYELEDADPERIGTELGVLPRAAHMMLTYWKGQLEAAENGMTPCAPVSPSIITTPTIRRPNTLLKTSASAAAATTPTTAQRKGSVTNATYLIPLRPQIRSIIFYALEIYLDEVRDLLTEGKPVVPFRDGASVDSATSTLLSDLTQPGKGLGYRMITCMNDLYNVFSAVTANRATAAHKRNNQSSRSHAVFLFRVEFEPAPKPPPTATALERRAAAIATREPSFLALVDLAGSERVKATEVKDVALQESQYINKSLSALCSVVYALHSGSKFVPYRDSRLTRLLRPCFESRRITAIVHVPPGPDSCDEALTTLKFAQRMKEVKLLHQSSLQGAVSDEALSLQDIAREVRTERVLMESVMQQSREYKELCAELRICNLQTGYVPRRVAHLLRQRVLDGKPANLIGEKNASNTLQQKQNEDDDIRTTPSEIERTTPVAGESAVVLTKKVDNKKPIQYRRPSAPQRYVDFLWSLQFEEFKRKCQDQMRAELLERALAPSVRQVRIMQESYEDLCNQWELLVADVAAVTRRNDLELNIVEEETVQSLKHDKRKELVAMDVLEVLQRRSRAVGKVERHLLKIESQFDADMALFRKQDEELKEDIAQRKEELKQYTKTNGAAAPYARQVCDVLETMASFVEYRRGVNQYEFNTRSSRVSIEERIATVERIEAWWSQLVESNPFKLPPPLFVRIPSSPYNGDGVTRSGSVSQTASSRVSPAPSPREPAHEQKQQTPTAWGRGPPSINAAHQVAAVSSGLCCTTAASGTTPPPSPPPQATTVCSTNPPPLRTLPMKRTLPPHTRVTPSAVPVVAAPIPSHKTAGVQPRVVPPRRRPSE